MLVPNTSKMRIRVAHLILLDRVGLSFPQVLSRIRRISNKAVKKKKQAVIQNIIATNVRRLRFKNQAKILIVGCYNGTELKFVAKVRHGFVPRLRREVFQRFAGLEIEKCPFTNLPEKRRTMWALTAEEMKECRWLKRLLVAQVEFTEWTPDGHLRHSSFAGLRDDKEARQIRR